MADLCANRLRHDVGGPEVLPAIPDHVKIDDSIVPTSRAGPIHEGSIACEVAHDLPRSKLGSSKSER